MAIVPIAIQVVNLATAVIAVRYSLPTSRSLGPAGDWRGTCPGVLLLALAWLWVRKFASNQEGSAVRCICGAAASAGVALPT